MAVMKSSAKSICLLVVVLLSAATLSVTAESAPPAVYAESRSSVQPSKSGNVITQVVGYAKDSVVRTVDGTKELWQNHKRCNAIRSKQQGHRDAIKARHELTDHGLTPKELRRRVQAINGGITYDEFIFLQKGKDDRGKLMNMIFLMWGAPKFFPYALMLYPEMLPSPFAMGIADLKETKLEKMSRQRSHAVLRTLMDIEKSAKVLPPFAKINIFGRRKQQRTMVIMNDVGKTAARLLQNGNFSPHNVLEATEKWLYSNDEISRAAKRLTFLPKPILNGLAEAIEGPNPLGSFLPTFVMRGKVLAHLKRVEDADMFLVEEKVDLNTVPFARLLEACNDRLIGSLGRSEQELRKDLGQWLDLVATEPQARIERTSEHFNSNFARSTLMSYYAMQAMSDARSSSYLPRVAIQGCGVVEETVQK